MDWQKCYHRLFQRYTSSELTNLQLINSEIDFIDSQIKTLQLQRKNLVAIKHRQEKEKMQETQQAKAKLRKVLGGKLPGEQ